MNTAIIAANNQKEMLIKIPSMIHDVIDASHRCAADMTHTLCVLGGGDMGEGILAFGRAFQVNGIILGSLATGLAFSAGIGIKKLHQHLNNKFTRIKSKMSDASPTITNNSLKGGDNMHKIIAGTDNQLGTALRLAYAFNLPFSVEGIMNEDHKFEFHVTVTADNEEFEKYKRNCEILFESED